MGVKLDTFVLPSICFILGKVQFLGQILSVAVMVVPAVSLELEFLIVPALAAT